MARLVAVVAGVFTALGLPLLLVIVLVTMACGSVWLWWSEDRKEDRADRDGP